MGATSDVRVAEAKGRNVACRLFVFSDALLVTHPRRRGIIRTTTTYTILHRFDLVLCDFETFSGALATGVIVTRSAAVVDNYGWPHSL